jgi:hypothetical protein
MEIDREAVNRWADEIMVMIDEDIDFAVSHRGDVMPHTVSSFSELHEYVDANDYFIQAEVPWSIDDQDVTNAVGDEVTRRLAARTAVKYTADLVNAVRRPRGADAFWQPEHDDYAVAAATPADAMVIAEKECKRRGESWRVCFLSLRRPE